MEKTLKNMGTADDYKYWLMKVLQNRPASNTYLDSERGIEVAKFMLDVEKTNYPFMRNDPEIFWIDVQLSVKYKLTNEEIKHICLNHCGFDTAKAHRKEVNAWREMMRGLKKLRAAEREHLKEWSDDNCEHAIEHTDAADYKNEQIRSALSILLKDRTTGRSIKWMTDKQEGVSADTEMEPNSILNEVHDIKRRAFKTKKERKSRTVEKAEVFTPSWVCNQMNNFTDDEWFGRKNVFNVAKDKTWTPTTEKIKMPEGMDWMDYVSLLKLEITCGEAPFITSRYDPETGEAIPVKSRIGFLDRKLRILGENTTTVTDWIRAALKALQCTYGYEWSGDNLLLARTNVLLTVAEHFKDKFGKEIPKEVLGPFAGIISWNLFQMDGLRNTVPNTETPVIIMDWENGKTIKFKELTNER